MRYYSKSNGCTYINSVHNGLMPQDAVPIDEDRYISVIANPVPGKVRSHDADGLPILIDPPPYVPTAEQIAAQVRAERDAKIEAVRWRIERHKDELELGIPLTEPLEPLLQYVQALRDVPQHDGFPENIEWPELPGVG